MLSESTKTVAEAKRRNFAHGSRLAILKVIALVNLVVLVGFLLLNLIFGWVSFSDKTTTAEYLDQIERQPLAKVKLDEVDYQSQPWRFASRTGTIKIPKSANDEVGFYQTSNLYECSSGLCEVKVEIQMHSGINWLENDDIDSKNLCKEIVLPSQSFSVGDGITRYVNYCGSEDGKISGMTFSSLDLKPGILSQQGRKDLILTTLFSAHFKDASNNVVSLPIEVMQNNYVFKVAETSLKSVRYD